MKKKNKKVFEIEVEDFKIYQVYRPKEHVFGRNRYTSSTVASPYFGSQVLDNQTYIDVTGTANIDEGLDFVRKPEDKHLSKEDLIKKYGTEFYEYQILNNAKINQITGYETKTEVKHKTVDKKVIEEKKSKLSFIESVDDFNNEVEEVKQEVNIFDEKTDFKISVNEEEIKESSPEKILDLPKQNVIPSFLLEEDDNDTVTNDDENYEKTIKETVTEEFEQSLKEDDDINVDAIDEALSEDERVEKEVEEVKPEVVEKQEEVKTEEVKEENYQSFKDYRIPYENILKKAEERVEEHPAWLEEKKEIINETLRAFNISGEVINYIKGPTFTLYEILLGSGVNVKKVSQINENLQMNLKSTSIRLLTPIPGRNTVGVEVPNDKRDNVLFSEIIDEAWINDNKPLNVSLGKDIYGKNVRQDITEMPHAIIAGQTKSGKSVCINTLLISLLLKNSPERLRLILVDPKKVELSFYQEIPHLACPVLDKPEEASEALKWAVNEMEHRYELLAKYRVKKIDDYEDKRKIDKTMPPMPYIVIVIDEFNDLIMQCGQDVNDSIIRLAQKARAAGIHVILATQRPTVDVVNGTIKSNVPCRIAFKVADSTNSSVILDEVGAESLLGRGDMLIKNNDAPQRAQGAYISDGEIDSICNYISSKYHVEFMFTDQDLRNSINSANQSNQVGTGSKNTEEPTELLYQIAEFCIESNGCSINAIINNFGLGFNRAQRIVKLFEELGIVSVKNGTKAREILVDSYKLREILGIDD